MKKTLGLDVSTSVVGITILENLSDELPNLLDHIELSKCKDIWEKADTVKEKLQSIKSNVDYADISNIFIEEALLGFRTGMSSAATITTLVRFNGIVSYIARDCFGFQPQLLSAATARRMCGFKLHKTAVAGPQKDQVFKLVTESFLKDVKWQLKKNGQPKDWSKDVVDSYVIARAGYMIQEQQNKL